MKLAHTLELAHINIRREMDGDDEGPVATDLKFTGTLPIDKLVDVFSTAVGYNVALASLYRDDGELVTHDVASMTLAREGIGVVVNIAAGLNTKLRFEGANVNRIKLTPQPGKVVELAMRVQVHPRTAELASITEWLGSNVEFDMLQAQTDLPLSSVPVTAPGVEVVKAPRGARAPVVGANGGARAS